MKNIKSELFDSLRSEYQRSDFGEIVRGKYAATQVDFHQLTNVLLTSIGEDEGVKILDQSMGQPLTPHQPGDWKYKIDKAQLITLRFWLSEFASIDQPLSNPTNVITSRDRRELQAALLKGMTVLRKKVALQTNQE